MTTDTEKKAPWWKWPQNVKPDNAPWFLLIWRSFWIVPMAIVAWFYVLLVLIGFGKRQAMGVRENILG